MTRPAASADDHEPPSGGRPRPAPAIDPDTFRRTMAAVQARPEDMQWATIPWQTDLWEARRLAAEQGKPIFLWAMNGNPLGCV
jgi:hypothetical protein